MPALLWDPPEGSIRPQGGGRVWNGIAQGYQQIWTGKVERRRLFDGGWPCGVLVRLREASGAATYDVFLSQVSSQGARVEWTEVVPPWGKTIALQAGSIVCEVLPDVPQNTLVAVVAPGTLAQVWQPETITVGGPVAFQPKPFARMVEILSVGAGNFADLGFGPFALAPGQVVRVAARPVTVTSGPAPSSVQVAWECVQ